MEITAFDLAQRYVGLEEVPGAQHNPLIMAMLKLDTPWPPGDETPWCSAFVNWIAWHLRLPRSKNLRARSWLEVGRAVLPDEAKVGFDVVVLRRGTLPQPGPENTTAPGHVGFYAGFGRHVYLLGGNQKNRVSVAAYEPDRILGIRRLWE